MKDNITLLTQPLDENRAQLEMLKRNLDTLLEFNLLNAKVLRSKYQALVAEGFTEDQALSLCK
jgi:hypothetical protein